VTLSGANTFSENAGSGLELNSFGPVSVSNLTAGGNVQHGALLRNDFLGATSGVTVSGMNQFTGNGFHGLDVISFGAISASNVTASGNGFSGGSDGVRLENHLGTGAAVKLTGTNNISGNASGLVVYSVGTVTLASITASGNTQGSGAYIDAPTAAWTFNPPSP